MLANGGEVSEGRLYILGGGVNRVLAEQFPHQQQLALPIILEVPPDYPEEQHILTIRLVDAKGKIIGPELLRAELPQSKPPEAVSGDRLRILALLGVMFQIPAEGRYRFVLALDDKDITDTSFRVESTGMAGKD